MYRIIALLIPISFLWLSNCAPPSGSALQLHVDQLEQSADSQPEIRPAYVRGIYLTNPTARDEKRLDFFLGQAKKYNLNSFVIDVQKKMVPKNLVERINAAGIYSIARIVVFEGGLKTVEISPAHEQRILSLLRDAAAQGFHEVQLDYIRYADDPALQRLTLKKKYGVINAFLEKAKKEADASGVYLSADVFGRITLNTNDHIGQKLENFALYTQALYPMVYPSHYLGDKERISSPYNTVKEGVKSAKDRLPDTRVVAYVQGFKIKVTPSGLSFPNYIKVQLNAVKDAGGDGWIIWNARNQYDPAFAAIAAADEKESQM